MNASARHLQETAQIASLIDTTACEACVRELVEVRARGGRLFILGVGGSAANASHAVNDFRKIAGIEAYAPTDNVSELTARTNDEGWASVFAEWLRGSRLTSRDLLLVLSVGGGSLERNVSPNLVEALQLGQQVAGKDALGGVLAQIIRNIRPSLCDFLAQRLIQERGQAAVNHSVKVPILALAVQHSRR
jgi:D-sedoheptulose 7-phosphate isomerase